MARMILDDISITNKEIRDGELWWLDISGGWTRKKGSSHWGTLNSHSGCVGRAGASVEGAIEGDDGGVGSACRLQLLDSRIKSMDLRGSSQNQIGIKLWKL
jgi:hypothetical protein